ncbi:hypothetical protein CTI12_AA046800 [Artemisia annua]|uniref:Transposase-associated domain-containing protein n=1 Tax=Artemisia annua TaxID=35608 RepID=A0A2U1QCG4_ARTAN|nr:hypothetical protein CTI12_AA046800 [Artemisia annua]
MDKSWIEAHITSGTFKEGVKSFIEFARARSIRGVIACPCLRCFNINHWDVGTCHGHILRYGFLLGYTNWSVHGETSEPLQPSRPSFVQNTTFGDDEIRSLVHDALGHLPSNRPLVVHGENYVPSQPSRPSFVQNTPFCDDEMRSLVRDALGLGLHFIICQFYLVEKKLDGAYACYEVALDTSRSGIAELL